MTELSKKIGEMEHDGLITNTIPQVQKAGGVLRKLGAATVLQRGTILAKSSGSAGDGKLVILGTTAASNETLTPDAILCDDTAIGTPVDVPVVVYQAGCFDPDKCAVKAGYTITEDDKDKLRERGIVFRVAAEAN